MRLERETEMDKIEMLSESFKLKYELFLNGCDSLEEIDRWDKESLGEMDTYYVNDLVSVVLRLIAADGVFSEKETEYLNRFFGFDYTPEDLQKIYADLKDAIDALFSEGIASGIEMLREINLPLSETYRDLLCTACDVIIASDSVIDGAELLLAQQLKDALGSEE